MPAFFVISWSGGKEPTIPERKSAVLRSRGVVGTRHREDVVDVERRVGFVAIAVQSTDDDRVMRNAGHGHTLVLADVAAG